MSNSKKPLVIVGDSAFAEVACEYFGLDSEYEVVAFSVEAPYLGKRELLGRPVVAFEQLVELYPPTTHSVFVAVVYTQMNRLRDRLVQASRSKGYPLASYISPNARVWPNVRIGEHCFIFEDNVVQPFVTIGDNVILWSGNHVGHHSTIRDNVFVASHVVISGFVDVGANCFLGVNAAVGNNVNIGRDCWLSPGITVWKDVPEGTLLRAAKADVSTVPALEFFKVEG